MDGGISFITIAIVKLGAALGASTGLISLIKWFNTYEYKYSPKRKGSGDDVADALKNISEKAGSPGKLR